MSLQDARERVVVVGAGIAGLAAAFRLQRLGYAVTVLEREDHVAGRMRTVEHQGYRLDLGAIWLSRNYRDMVRLIAETGLTTSIRPTSSLFGVVREGRVHRLRADRRTDLARTGLLSWRSKLKAINLLRDEYRSRPLLTWADLSAAGPLDNETARSYAMRRLNDELYSYLIDPLCRGFYFTEPDRVSAVGVPLALKTLFGAPTFNFDDGIDTLPRHLATLLPVETGARVTGVEETGDGVRVTWGRAGEPDHTEDAAACVVAVPAPDAAGLVHRLTADQRDYLDSVAYLRNIHVFFGLTRPPDEPATFVLFPKAENPALTFIALDHHRAPHRVPTGHGLISVWFDDEWSRSRWDGDDGGIADEALDVLGVSLPELSGHLREHQDMTMVQRWDRAVVHSAAGSYHRLRRFTASIPTDSRVQFAGDYLSFSATNAALATGERAAENIRIALNVS